MTRFRQTRRGAVVRKLTTCTHFVSLGVVILTLAAANAGAAEQWQSTEAIAVAAENFVLQQSTGMASETTVKASNIDSRHRLSRCDRALETFLRRGSRVQSRTVVGVRCSGSRPWKIYVPVDVVVTKEILATRHALPRDHILTAADLATVARDVSRLRRGYFADNLQVVGLRLKAPLIGGQVLTPAMLQASIMIRRGQSVTLVVGSGRFRIQVKGKALMDGALRQRIRVENSSSGRVVEGVVRSAEHVEILTSSNDHLISITPKDLPRVADTRLSNNDR